MTDKYKRYLRSEEWKKKREEVFLKKGRFCSVCRSRSNLHIHHTTYKNLFNEPLSDLVVLCDHCHRSEHSIETPFQKKIRKLENRRKRRRNRRKNR